MGSGRSRPIHIEILPNIVERQSFKHMKLNREAVQIITGHGVFKDYLFKHNKCDSEQCDSFHGHDDSPQHVLINCPEYEEDRTALKQLTEITGLRWSYGFLSETMRRSKKLINSEER